MKTENCKEKPPKVPQIPMNQEPQPQICKPVELKETNLGEPDLLSIHALLTESKKLRERCVEKASQTAQILKKLQSDMASKEPQSDVAQKKVQEGFLQKEAKLSLTLQVEKTKASNPAGGSDGQTKLKITKVNQISSTKDSDGEAANIKREQMSLFAEVERLKEMLHTQEALRAVETVAQRTKAEMLRLDLIKEERAENKVPQKVIKPVEASAADKMKQKNEMDRLLSVLAQAEEDLNKKRLRWQEEKSRLLEYVREQQASQWKTDKNVLTDKTDNPGQEEADLEKDTKKKSKKPSMWKRFLQFFKTSSDS